MRGIDRCVAAVGALAGLIGGLLGIAWGNTEPCPTHCPSGKVPLGIAAPATGAPAVFGRQTIKPVEIVVNDLNATGGLFGISVDIVVGDDRCDPGASVVVATRHVEQDRVNFVIGPICPAAAMAAAPIYARAGVVQFIPTVTMVELTERYPDNIFRMVATDLQEARAFAAYMASERKGRRLAIVYTDVFYRRTVANIIQAALPADMKGSTRLEPVLDVTGAYDRLADKLQRDPPDVIYMALDSQPVVDFVRKVRERGIRSFLIGGQHLLSQSFWSTARSSAEGIHVIAPIQSSASAEFRKAVQKIRAVDVVPDLVALNSYAAVQVWAEAIRLAGSGDPKRVVATLRSGTFDTAIGSVAFDQRGDRRGMCYSVLTWQNGRLVSGLDWPGQASGC